jgi:hypothetical protein
MSKISRTFSVKSKDNYAENIDAYYEAGWIIRQTYLYHIN